jgi:DNA-binding GntR family transcriptional regulator
MRESVGDAIRQALYDGRFGPGQSLSEAALAAEMSISRGPVREALLLLAQEGLVIHSPNRGFSVVQITGEDLREIQQVRMPLEAMALNLAKAHLTEADFLKLEDLKTPDGFRVSGK